MRLFRLFLYFVVGLLLGASSVLAFAETIPATQSTTDFTWTHGTCSGTLSSVADCWCVQNRAAYLPTATGGKGVVSNAPNGQFYCTAKAWDGSDVSYAFYRTATKGAGVYVCPAGYDGPKTVGDQPNMCEQLDKCASTKDKSFSGWVVKPAGGYSGVVCIDGCQYDQLLSIDTSNPQDERIGKDGRIWGQVSQYGKGTSCSGSSPDQGQPDQNNKQAKPPICGGTDGVMTTSTGKVLCVPEGTPDARKPDVEKKTKTETASNGDKVTTESTTTTDPQTNAKQTNTTTTTTTSAGTSVSTSTSTSSGNVGTAGGAAGGGSCTGDNCTDNASKGKFGEYGELWKKKYPDGVSKVVTDKVTEMKQSNLGKLVSDLAPVGIGSSGTCPAWTFDANIGHRMNFGSGSYAPPCWLWTALRAVFLITTLFMARRIIFGG